MHIDKSSPFDQKVISGHVLLEQTIFGLKRLSDADSRNVWFVGVGMNLEQTIDGNLHYEDHLI